MISLNSDLSKIILGLVLFFVPIIGYSIQLPFFQNCFNLTRILGIYAIVGAAIGLALGIILLQKQEEDFHKLQIGIAGIVIGVLLFPLLFISLNRILPTSTSEILKVPVVSVHEVRQSRFGDLGLDLEAEGYYIFVLVDEEVLRLHSESTKDVEEITEGAITELEFHRGILGLKWGRLLLSGQSI
ncbi:MAG: hypothetical protein HKN16_11560 [Saprospiraceae bacterium]|nr:hypothetical protein [Saprospiraceae bacterium]